MSQGPEYDVPIPWDAVEYDGGVPNPGVLNTVLQNLQNQILALQNTVGGGVPVTTGKTDFALSVGAAPGYIAQWATYIGWFTVPAALTSASIAAAYAAAQARGYGMVCLTPGATYVFTSTLVLTTGLNAIQFKCFGQCTFDMRGMADGSIGIQWNGSAGGRAFDLIENVSFLGKGPNNGQYAIEFSNLSCAQVRKCDFDGFGTGVLFANNNSFTESCVVWDSTWEHCNRAVEYLRIAADTSFHGSGLRGSNIINLASSASCAVYIGPEAQPYLAPMEIKVFTGNALAPFPFNTGGACTIINSQSVRAFSFKGWITLEGPRSISASLCNPNAGIFIGPLGSNGPTWVKGALTLAGDVILNLDGTITDREGRISVEHQNYINGNAVIGITGGWECAVTLQNADRTYDYRYVFTAMANDFSASGYVDTRAADPLRNVDTHGYGPPAFTVNSVGSLIITNATLPTAGITVYCDAHRISQKLNYNRNTGFARINDLFSVTFLAADVTLNPTNTINFPLGMQFYLNNRIRYSAEVGTITGLTSGSYYYIVNIVGTTLQLSDTTQGSAKVLTAVTGGGRFTLFTY